MREEIKIREERISPVEYISLLKRTNLGSQYPKERFEERISKIAEYITVDGFQIMDKFSPKNLEENVGVFDQAMNKYLAEYRKVGIRPKHFGSMTEFIKSYNIEISEEK